MNKKVIAVLALFSLQFLVTACWPCKCDAAKTFEKTYNALEVKTWNTSGFNNVPVQGTVPKNGFGLTVEALFDLKQIAQQFNFNLKDFGFTSAYALSQCDCPQDEYINTDPLKAMKILVSAKDSQEFTEVTQQFTVEGYDGKAMSISDLFKDLAEWHGAFRLDLKEVDGIPDEAVFKAVMILKSGKELSKTTAVVSFM